MSKVVAQSIFSTKTAETRSWQSLVTSGTVHVLLVFALLYITFPAVRDVVHPKDHTTLIAPVLPKYQPKPVPIPHQKVIFKEQKFVPLPKHFIPPPVVKPPEVKHVEVAKAPEIKQALPKAPDVKIEAPPVPKPPVKTGVFESQELAKGPKAPTPSAKVGGFGDPNGVPANANSRPGPVQMAKLGSFDLPNGGGNAGGGGKSMNGGVKAAGFGDAGDPNGVAGGTGRRPGGIKTGGFDAAPAAKAATPVVQEAPKMTKLEVTYKPKPVYTDEARRLGIEGQVLLEVVFGADGQVHVLRVLRGLGHGLDEAAEAAARQVRFKPMTKDGVPVDAKASLTITFETT